MPKSSEIWPNYDGENEVYRTCRMCGDLSTETPVTEAPDDLLYSGRLYPESQMIQEEDGYWYCQTHWKIRWPAKRRDEWKMEVEEETE